MPPAKVPPLKLLPPAQSSPHPKPLPVTDGAAREWLEWLDQNYATVHDKGVIAWMDDLRARLYGEYRATERPQYKVIVDVVVELDGMCREIHRQGSALSREYLQFRNMELQWIKQLQRHTEELSFSIRQYKDDTETFMQVVWQVMNEMLPYDRKVEVMKELSTRLNKALRVIPQTLPHAEVPKGAGVTGLPPGMVLVKKRGYDEDAD